MPLKGFEVKRITFKDSVSFQFNEIIKDEKINYPAKIFKEFAEYLNSKYHSGVFGDNFTRKGKNASSINLVFYVPSDFTKDEVLKDIKDFEEKYPELIGIDVKMPRTTV